MEFSKKTLFLFVLIAVFCSVAARPDFWKELEGVGQRVRDAVISAGPAVDVVNKAVNVFKGDE